MILMRPGACDLPGVLVMSAAALIGATFLASSCSLREGGVGSDSWSRIHDAADLVARYSRSDVDSEAGTLDIESPAQASGTVTLDGFASALDGARRRELALIELEKTALLWRDEELDRIERAVFGAGFARVVIVQLLGIRPADGKLPIVRDRSAGDHSDAQE